MTDKATTALEFADNVDFDRILTNPILDIAARFWASERYDAFRVCYRSMREIDDLVDDRKAEGDPISATEAEQIETSMLRWLQLVQTGQVKDHFSAEFLAIRQRFGIPWWPWIRLVRAMTYDLTHNGFSSLVAFLRYAEGAAIAPASVFMHLSGVRNEGEGYTEPPYDIRWAARPLAIFSYLVHIIRDFEKDTQRGLIYFADDLLAKHGLTHADLREAGETGRWSGELRSLIGEYRRFAEYYRQIARNTVDEVRPMLQPPYQLSLEVIYSLYAQIFERIDPDGGSFSGDALNPDPSEVKERLELTVARFRPVKTT